MTAINSLQTKLSRITGIPVGWDAKPDALVVWRPSQPRGMFNGNFDLHAINLNQILSRQTYLKGI